MAQFVRFMAPSAKKLATDDSAPVVEPVPSRTGNKGAVGLLLRPAIEERGEGFVTARDLCMTVRGYVEANGGNGASSEPPSP